MQRPCQVRDEEVFRYRSGDSEQYGYEDSIDYNKLVEETKLLDWKEATMTDSMWYTN